MKISSFFTKTILLAAIAIPMDDKSVWTELQFKKITPNKVSYAKESLTVEVESSARP